MANRRTLKQMTDAECIEAYRLNQQGEGCAMISGYGDFCSYQTANAMINRGERLVAERPARLVAKDVERLKVEGRYVHAGALQAALGMDHYFGCHYGMRSTLDGAKAAFRDGFMWATAAMQEDSVPSSRYVASAYSYDHD